MSRRRVLVIGMLDSVHLAKWLSQFTEVSIDFFLYPSKKFRRFHPLLKELVKEGGVANIKILGASNLSPYLDFLFHELAPLLFGTRAEKIRRIVNVNHFDVIHAVEIQGAGYIIANSIDKESKPSPIILTNWGSDIYFYSQLPDHRKKIVKALELADFYSAECERDYKLAADLGFKGVNLPCIPNSGGIGVDESEIFNNSAANRDLILVKGYGGIFGRIDISLDALKRVLPDFPEIKVFIYSVTKDVLNLVQGFSDLFPGQIKFSTVNQSISIEEMRTLMSQARVYVGCSRSDGISTSFLEALSCGVYPIQTKTSCADEWVRRGAIASLVSLDSVELSEKILNALIDDALVNSAQVRNTKIAKDFLNPILVSEQAIKFYQI